MQNNIEKILDEQERRRRYYLDNDTKYVAKDANGRGDDENLSDTFNNN